MSLLIILSRLLLGLLSGSVFCSARIPVTMETWMRGAPIWSEGGAVFYAPEVMEATAAYRGIDLDGYVDGVALMSPADLGKEVWIRREGAWWEGPFLSVDTAMRADMCNVVTNRGEVVEVGYATAERWGMVSWPDVHIWKISVEVSLLEPDWLFKAQLLFDGGGPELVHYPSWWAARARLE